MGEAGVSEALTTLRRVAVVGLKFRRKLATGLWPDGLGGGRTAHGVGLLLWAC
jgi:hypothetical protein